MKILIRVWNSFLRSWRQMQLRVQSLFLRLLSPNPFLWLRFTLPVHFCLRLSNSDICKNTITTHKKGSHTKSHKLNEFFISYVFVDPLVLQLRLYNPMTDTLSLQRFKNKPVLVTQHSVPVQCLS